MQNPLQLMSLENSDAATVGVQKSQSFKYKEGKTSRPPIKKKLFMSQAKVKSSVDQQTTKLFLHLWAKAARNKDNDKDKVKDNDSNDENMELTLNLPKFTRNAQGNWVALKWGYTPVGVWQDTRFFQGDKYRPLGSMTEDKLIKKDYYPVYVIKILQLFFIIFLINNNSYYCNKIELRNYRPSALERVKFIIFPHRRII